MELICLDTTILIDHRRAKDKSKSLLFRIAARYSIAVTAVTVFELWKGGQLRGGCHLASTILDNDPPGF
jgi:predicted nucleic acid-binding protein